MFQNEYKEKAEMKMFQDHSKFWLELNILGRRLTPMFFKYKIKMILNVKHLSLIVKCICLT